MKKWYTSIVCCKNPLIILKNRDISIMMGDFNAKIGKLSSNSDICGIYDLGDQNERGANLLEFCSVYNLAVVNTLFKNDPSHLYTRVSSERKRAIKLNTL